MYQSNKLVKGLGMNYEKIYVCQNNCIFFWNEHKEENKCLKYDKTRYVDIKIDDGETVTTEVTRKQLRFIALHID
jgi:hypothetical protein